MHSRSKRCAAASLIVLAAAILGAWGSSLEQTARDSIEYARQNIAEVQKLHPAVDVTKAQAAIIEVGSALTVYCNGAAYQSGGKCDKAKSSDVRKATGRNLKTRLATLADAIADIEAKH